MAPRPKSLSLRALTDLQQIRHLKARYCRFVDQKDWTAFGRLFSEVARIEIAGAPGGEDDLQRFERSEDFVDALKALMQPLKTVHHVHSPEIDLISETRAKAIWAVADRLVYPAGSSLSVLQGWGHYEETYDRSSGEWLIDSLRLTRLLVEPIEG